MLKYLWQAEFEDGKHIDQPENDRYSKYNPEAAYNPSAFRDILDYEKISPLRSFTLRSHDSLGKVYGVDLKTGEFFIEGAMIKLERPLEELRNRRLIYFRTMRANMVTHEQGVYAYNFGYKGKDKNGKVVEKVITING